MQFVNSLVVLNLHTPIPEGMGFLDTNATSQKKERLSIPPFFDN